MAKVRGNITFDGTVVSSGSVEFWPDAGRPARGEIKEDGSYELTTFEPGDGAIVGHHVVTIRSSVVEESGAPEISSMEQEMQHFSNPNAPRLARRQVRFIVPEHFSRRESSGLETIVESKTNTINWNLKSAP